MGTPRIEIDLDKIAHNASVLVERLAAKGIRVSGVTKAMLGSPAIARAMLVGGVTSLGDSRIENVEHMRAAGVANPMTLVRSPMLSQVDAVIDLVEASLNSESVVIERLSVAAGRQHKTHSVVLMVELGDLREGVPVGDLHDLVRSTLRQPNIELSGLGTNLACQSGVSPDARNMARLSELVESVEEAFGIQLDVVSGGNSANLEWALTTSDPGRINELRLGESILLGCETLHRRPIEGLHTDAIRVIAEVIESKEKPAQPWGTIAQAAFGEPPAGTGAGSMRRSLLAIGRQDVDPAGLSCPVGARILGASSDHLVVEAGPGGPDGPAIGDELAFVPDYSALLRAMTSPFLAKTYTGGAAQLNS